MTLNFYSVPHSRIWAERVNKEDVTRLLWYENTKQGDLMGSYYTPIYLFKRIGKLCVPTRRPS